MSASAIQALLQIGNVFQGIELTRFVQPAVYQSLTRSAPFENSSENRVSLKKTSRGRCVVRGSEDFLEAQVAALAVVECLQRPSQARRLETRGSVRLPLPAAEAG